MNTQDKPATAELYADIAKLLQKHTSATPPVAERYARLMAATAKKIFGNALTAADLTPAAFFSLLFLTVEDPGHNTKDPAVTPSTRPPITFDVEAAAGGPRAEVAIDVEPDE